MMNPEYFDIENLKIFGMWPHQSFISRGINPYIKRINKDKVYIAAIGDLKGESIVDMLDNCGDKIEKIYVINKYEGDDADLVKSIFTKNTKNVKGKLVFKKDIQDLNGKDYLMDVVCVSDTSCTIDNLVLSYNITAANGIFCGNGHEADKVKVALNGFRRQEKIGTPIQVSNRSIWFWNKRAL
jgi:hypothetical protein